MANGVNGRPETITPEIVKVLKEAFAIGCSDREAIVYTEAKLSTKEKPIHIAESVFYDYQKRHEGFLEEKENLKLKPTLKARYTVVNSLDNPEFALKYLAKKKRDEFGEKLDITTDGKPISNTINLGVFTLEELKQFERLTQKATIEGATPTDTVGDIQKELL